MIRYSVFDFVRNNLTRSAEIAGCEITLVVSQSNTIKLLATRLNKVTIPSPRLAAAIPQ